MSRLGFLMTKLGIYTGIVLAVAGASCAVDAWAADIMPMKAPPAAAASAPKPCTDAWDFIATDCQLTWQGITVYGTIADSRRLTARITPARIADEVGELNRRPPQLRTRKSASDQRVHRGDLLDRHLANTASMHSHYSDLTARTAMLQELFS